MKWAVGPFCVLLGALSAGFLQSTGTDAVTVAFCFGAWCVLGVAVTVGEATR